MQVAAINMQGRDRPVWISRAFFSKNGGCGYVKKPDILLPGSNFRYLKSSNPEFMTELEPKLELKVSTFSPPIGLIFGAVCSSAL